MIIMPTKEPRWYKDVFRGKGIKLWQLSRILGVREPILSRWLNGVQEVPPAIDAALEALATALIAEEVVEEGGLPGDAGDHEPEQEVLTEGARQNENESTGTQDVGRLR